MTDDTRRRDQLAANSPELALEIITFLRAALAERDAALAEAEHDAAKWRVKAKAATALATRRQTALAAAYKSVSNCCSRFGGCWPDKLRPAPTGEPPHGIGLDGLCAECDAAAPTGERTPIQGVKFYPDVTEEELVMVEVDDESCAATGEPTP